MHHKGVKNYMELSISIYRTVGIEFPSLYALFGEQKKRTTWVSSASIVLNALLETSELTTIETSQCWKNPGNCLILENCERSEYNFLLFLAQEFKFLKKLAVQPEWRLVWKFPFNLWSSLMASKAFKVRFWVRCQNSGFHWEKPQKSPALNALERWGSLWPSLLASFSESMNGTGMLLGGLFSTLGNKFEYTKVFIFWV